MTSTSEITYRVYKANGAKCIIKGTNLQYLKEWCWQRSCGNTYRIEWQYEDEDSPRRMFV